MQELIENAYNKLKANKDGNVADYIPQLASVAPDKFAISFCSITGEQYDIGDVNDYFCIQSCSKPLSYCLARSLNEDLHKHVGYEPSGESFNAHILTRQGLPHNPMINAGAIMVATMIYPELEPADRFTKLQSFFNKLAGTENDIKFDMGVFLSEQYHADRNTSLAYFMRENNAYNKKPSQNDINNHLNLYFQACSLSLNSHLGSIIAATLANGGKCPITNEIVVEKNIVRDCMTLMFQCGMYEYSGQFAFEIGLPAKSGVSGCLFLVIPNIGGFCIWSPRLDDTGNTVRGLEFCRYFVKNTKNKFHIFHSITFQNDSSRFQVSQNKEILEQQLINAAADGDLDFIKSITKDVNLSCKDYDSRTPIHLAAGEGHYDIVEYLIDNNVEFEVKDRWGTTPLEEAIKGTQGFYSEEKKTMYEKIKELLENIKKKNSQ